MKCPSCNSTCSLVTDVRRFPEFLKRYRLCRDCSIKFVTIERVEVFSREAGGYEPTLSVVENKPAKRKRSPLPEDITERPEPQTAQAKPQRFWNITPADVAGDLDGLQADVCDALLEWWNSARRSKWGARATWTRTAWQQSVTRVKALQAAQQLVLAKAGAEHGWQSLKPSFLDGRGPVLPVVETSGRPMPKDPAMLAAIGSWPPEQA